MNNLEGAKTLLAEVQQRVDNEAGLTAENRFWSVLVAATVTGLIIAKRAGLVDYDTNKVFRWGVEQLKENKARSRT